jgi:REP element-mobilizing transposase RayT
VGQASLPALPQSGEILVHRVNEAAFYRRRLPHIRADGSIYFVTWRLCPGRVDLSFDERGCIAQALRYFDAARHSLHAYVVMNDHIHVLVEPHPDCSLSDILHSWKSFTARQMQRDHGRSGVVWQDESFDHVIRSDAEYREKRDYILQNAFKRWPELDGYPWQWARGL